MSEHESLLSVDQKKSEWRYEPVPGVWDEALAPSGFPRRHWRRVTTAIGRMGFGQLSRSWYAGQQLIHDHGTTYNSVSDPNVNERPWPMDPIPIVIADDEWPAIEKAVAQRARLLELMLSDLYGEQRLLRDRLLPSALVFGNPHFLRPCHGIKPAGGVHLHTYAVDLARSPDGRWWVIADRTQSPSGIGYALENRMLSARTLPGIFTQCNVRQLSRFFDTRRDALLTMASHLRSNPRVVLLTPGPYNETYFEHSFLAGHWGFPLVEGADLTVRDDHVYLKTLGGLEPVDLILRRVDDSFCDPIELRGDSLLGVPGLLHAIRCGTVIVANALGSGLVETPAQMAFLPGLSRQLLGEDLLLPSVATWWCGQKNARNYVLDHLDGLVVKPTFARFDRYPEFPASDDKSAYAALVRRIEAHPEEFVAQERIALSTAPVRTETGLAPRHIVLRVFAIWDGEGFSVMPGGLTRVSIEKESLVVSMKFGGGSKDTWVVGGAEQAPALPVHLPKSVDTQASRASLPSRIADNLFWLGRYAERVEARVRLVRTLLPALSGEEDFGRAASLETAIHLLSRLRFLPPETASASIGEQRWTVQRILTEMIYDASQTSSLRWNLKEMRRVAWQVKERLSSDTWRVLQELENHFSGFVPASADHRYYAGMQLVDHVIVTLSAFAGLLMENTTRGHGWRFLEIGRRMERALQSAELLRSGLAAAPADIEPYLQILLQIADSSITYRSRYTTVLQTHFVLDLLLTDEANPRSVGFQAATLLHQIDRLQEFDGNRHNRLERPLALKIVTAVRECDTEKLSVRDKEGRLPALEELVEFVKATLYDLSDEMTAEYLSHLTASRLTASS